MIQRIQAAVFLYSELAKICNVSANASSPTEGDEMSIIGFELDVLQLRYGVQFVVSAGNHELWKTESSIDDILDDDSRIAPPADSMLSIVVGAVTCEDHVGSLSGKNIVLRTADAAQDFRASLTPICVPMEALLFWKKTALMYHVIPEPWS